MKRKSVLVGMLVLGLLLAVAVGMTQAQAPEFPEGEAGLLEESSTAAAVWGSIPIQGRLTDAGGSPLNGTYSIRFALYEVSSGGTALCEDTNSVSVANGLFYSEIYGNCGSDDVNGRQLYLGIKVGADPEMTPRRGIYPVPYALSLMPGAFISDTFSANAILDIENWGSTGRGLRSYAMSLTGTNYGVVGASRSPDGYGGYFYNNGGGVGLRGESNTGIAIQAAGTGIIKSAAPIIIAVSPLKMLPQWESIGDVELLSDGAYIEIRPVTAGFQYVHIPVDLPGVLFGTPTRLQGIRVCYKDDQTASFLSTTIVSQGTDAGTLSYFINDVTDRKSTSWQCYTVTDATPDPITGSVYIQLTFEFAGTGAAHDIRIGNIALTLTE